jgi:hypothetical protein
MFVGFSKTLTRMGAFKIGAGVRITKKNAIYMLFVLFFVYMAKFTWYMVVGMGWLVYGMVYLCCLPFRHKGKNKRNPISPSRTSININDNNREPEQKPPYKRWYVWVAGIVIFSFIVSPFLPKEEAPPPTVDAMAATDETPEPEATPLPTEEPTPEPTESTPYNSTFDTAYTGAYYEVLYESDYTDGDTNPKIYELYGDISVNNEGWHDEVKAILSHFNGQHEPHSDLICRIFDTRDYKSNGQTLYQHLYALWDSSEGELTFYPNNGSGINVESIKESWQPTEEPTQQTIDIIKTIPFYERHQRAMKRKARAYNCGILSSQKRHTTEHAEVSGAAVLLLARIIISRRTPVQAPTSRPTSL